MSSITIKGNDVNIIDFPPTSSSRNSVIVIAYGTDGFRNTSNGNWQTMMTEYANELAAKGFYVMIPDYFQSTDTTAGLGAFFAFATQPNADDAWANTLATVISEAETLTSIRDPNVGLLGFSLGGHLCLKIRSLVDVMVEFFAPASLLFSSLGVNSRGSSLKIQIHHGDPDSVVDFSNATQIRTRLEREGSSVELFKYPRANHGFTDNPTARINSKLETISFFDANL